MLLGESGWKADFRFSMKVVLPRPDSPTCTAPSSHKLAQANGDDNQHAGNVKYSDSHQQTLSPVHLESMTPGIVDIS